VKAQGSTCVQCKQSKTRCVWTTFGAAPSPKKTRLRKAIAEAESAVDIRPATPSPMPQKRPIRRVTLKLKPKVDPTTFDEEVSSGILFSRPPTFGRVGESSKGKEKAVERESSNGRRKGKGKGKAVERVPPVPAQAAIPPGCEYDRFLPASN
jgi:hypothetical protein